MRRSVLFFILFFTVLFFTREGLGQLNLSRKAAVDSAYKNHPGVLATLRQVERQQALWRGSFLPGKTEFWLEAPTSTRFALGVQQNFSFPALYFNEAKLQKENTRLAEKEVNIQKNTIGKNIEVLYLDLQYAQSRLGQLRYQDSIYGRLYKATEKRYSAGEVEYLEKVFEESKYSEANSQLLQMYKEVESLKAQLLMMTGIQVDSFTVDPFKKYDFQEYSRRDTSFLLSNPLVGYYHHNRLVSQRFLKVQRSNFMPGFFAGYLNQGNRDSEMLYRFRFGISVPLWFPAYTSRIKSARIGMDIAEYQYKAAIHSVRIEYFKIYSALEKQQLNLRYFEEKGLMQADEIIKSSNRLYSIGEISYFNHLLGLAQGMEIKMRYLNALKEYNQFIIALKYMRGE